MKLSRLLRVLLCVRPVNRGNNGRGLQISHLVALMQDCLQFYVCKCLCNYNSMFVSVYALFNTVQRLHIVSLVV